MLTLRKLVLPALLSVYLWGMIIGGIALWANMTVTDPADQCSDTSVNKVARFISCTIEGR
jgi:hypothetical protein